MAELTAPKEHEVAHHFDDLEQEFESHKMGMWLFLASEIMMFGALLVGGFILMFGPAIWLVNSSFKTPAGLAEFPPTLLPYVTAEAMVETDLL